MSSPKDVTSASSKKEELNAPNEGQDAETAQKFRVKVSNLHKLIGKKELADAFATVLNIEPPKAFIVCYGPKSTGNGWVEFDTAENALSAIHSMNGHLLRGQPISLSMENKNKEERRIKREKKSRGKKKELPYQEEIDQVKGRYASSFQMISDEVPVTFQLNLKPSDPDFPFDLENVQLRIEMPEDYPQEVPQFTVLNEDLSAKLKEKISKALQQRAQVAYKNKTTMILGLLKWLDNSLERLLVDKEATQDFHLQQAGIQIITHAPTVKKDTRSEQEIAEQLRKDREMQWMEAMLQEKEVKDAKEETKEAKEEEDEEEEDEDEEDEGEEEEKVPRNGGEGKFATTTAHRGTQIRAQGLQLKDIGIVECTQLSLVVQCTRCRAQVPIVLKPQLTHAIECDKCHTAHIVNFRPEKMHESSSIIGYLDIENCTPFELLPSNFLASCLECLHECTFNKVAYTGTETSQNCQGCHKRLSISIGHVTFVKIRPSRPTDPNVVIVRKKKEKDPRLQGIKAGTPLPDQGSCKHYRKSKRWLKFPCCGRSFPCDICHEENSDGHEMKWATRMLCGYCSREQPFSGTKPCVFCGGEVSGTSRTRFWEGGQGCRDPKKMNRNDPRKYRGTNKTQSMKSTRVGEKKG